MIRRTCCMLALGLAAVAAVPSVSPAQERQGRGDFDPAQFRERMLNDIKERLAATDEEWTVLKPKVEKVQAAQMAAMSGRFGGFRGRGGDGNRGGDSNRQRSATEQASRDLRELLENKDAPADQIVEKLKAVREARAKAKAELEAAQKDLQSVLTPRQEAVLVSSGTLE